ncbi:MAG TPA: hypothetical protein VMD98_08845 [Bryocella sp.]|nr:hypothetical protein [Bryocella sp.]
MFSNSNPDQNGSGDTTQSGTDQTQAGSDNTQSGVNGPQDTFTHPEELPALSAFSDAISHTGLKLTTAVGYLVQRVGSQGSPSYNDNLTSFDEGISIAQFKPSIAWVLSYDGGLSLNTGYGYSYNNLNQSANGSILWNFAKRWQVRARDSYLYSDDPFQPFLTYLGQPTPNNPNPVTYYPQSVVEQNTGHLDVTYELSPHDVINFSGTEGFIRYLRGGYPSIYNTINYSEGAFYQHQFTARMAAGGGYQFGQLDFGHGESRAGVHTFEGFISYVFSSKLQASLWIGPELTSTKDIIPVYCTPYGCFVEIQHQSSWSVAEGGTLGWRITPVDSLHVMVSRGVSNVGGILGAAYIYQITATYGRPITREWNLGAGLNYNHSNSVSEIEGDQYLHATTGTIGVNRRLFNDSWNFSAYYAFIRQSENYVGLPAVTSSNGLGVSIRYSWNHSLGR